jgi:hypothetical protein
LEENITMPHRCVGSHNKELFPNFVLPRKGLKPQNKTFNGRHESIRQQEKDWGTKQGLELEKFKRKPRRKKFKIKCTSMLIIHSAELAP